MANAKWNGAAARQRMANIPYAEIEELRVAKMCELKAEETAKLEAALHRAEEELARREQEYGEILSDYVAAGGQLDDALCQAIEDAGMTKLLTQFVAVAVAGSAAPAARPLVQSATVAQLPLPPAALGGTATPLPIPPPALPITPASSAQPPLDADTPPPAPATPAGGVIVPSLSLATSTLPPPLDWAGGPDSAVLPPLLPNSPQPDAYSAATLTDEATPGPPQTLAAQAEMAQIAAPTIASMPARAPLNTAEGEDEAANRATMQLPPAGVGPPEASSSDQPAPASDNAANFVAPSVRAEDYDFAAPSLTAVSVRLETAPASSTARAAAATPARPEPNLSPIDDDEIPAYLRYRPELLGGSYADADSAASLAPQVSASGPNTPTGVDLGATAASVEWGEAPNSGDAAAAFGPNANAVAAQFGPNTNTATEFGPNTPAASGSAANVSVAEVEFGPNIQDAAEFGPNIPAAHPNMTALRAEPVLSTVTVRPALPMVTVVADGDTPLTINPGFRGVGAAEDLLAAVAAKLGAQA